MGNDHCKPCGDRDFIERRILDVQSFASNISGDRSGNVPSTWREIVDWCEEATRLAILVETRPDSRDGDNRKEPRISPDFLWFTKFVPFVHCDILNTPKFHNFDRSSPYIEDYIIPKSIFGRGSSATKQNAKKETDVKRSCSTHDLEDRFPLNWLSLLTVYNGKILISVERGESPEKKSCQEYITISELGAILVLLRMLKKALRTGYQCVREPKNLDIVGTQGVDDLRETASISEKGAMKLGYGSDDECVICMDSKTQLVLPCTHGFCRRCATHWMKEHEHCPVCRSALSVDDFETEQWQLETWSMQYIKEQINAIQKKLQLFYVGINGRRRGKANSVWRENDFLQLISCGVA